MAKKEWELAQNEKERNAKIGKWDPFHSPLANLGLSELIYGANQPPYFTHLGLSLSAPIQVSRPLVVVRVSKARKKFLFTTKTAWPKL